MGGAAGGEMPRDPHDLVPPATIEGLRKIIEDLGIEFQQAPPQPAAPARRAGAGSSDEQMEVVIEEKIPVFAAGLGNPAPWAEAPRERDEGDRARRQREERAPRRRRRTRTSSSRRAPRPAATPGRIGTMALLPQVVDAVAPTAGAWRRAASATGAASPARWRWGRGVWIGTAFLVSREATLAGRAEGAHPRRRRKRTRASRSCTAARRCATSPTR